MIDCADKRKKLIRRSKKYVVAQIANSCKTNLKEFQSYVKTKRVLTSTIVPLTENGKQIDNEVDMANTLNYQLLFNSLHD